MFALHPSRARAWGSLRPMCFPITPFSALSSSATTVDATVDAVNMGIDILPPIGNKDTKNDQTLGTDPAATKIVPERWVNGMPSRLIAQLLLGKSRHMADHKELFEETSSTGLFKSRRHFKHCLKLMKCSKRVDIICLGPERVGSSHRKFSVKLTTRGARIYSSYRQWPGPKESSTNQSNSNESDASSRGLADVL